MAGIYIHIPFCASRCIYCGFYSTTSPKLQDRYVDALCKELEMQQGYISEPVTTIYLGGGTPSQLTGNNLTKLFSTIRRLYTTQHPELPLQQQYDEVTIECNPDDVTPEFCNILRELPVNRVSMGAQTFSDQRLKFLHRRHTSEEVMMATQRLRAAGISNISIDLMFGFPGETLFDWEEDLWMALALNPQHISAYSLMYEEGTPLYRMLEKGEIEEIDEELSRQMYNRLIDHLTAAGYEQYEISNFARPGFRSKHNSSYWHEVPYLGIGASAHSFNRESRQWNVANITKYMDSIEQGIIPFEQEELDLNTRYDDLITTALRTREGINLEAMKEEYGNPLYDYLIRNAQQAIKGGLLQVSDHHLSLTRKGLYVSDDVMSDLIYIDPEEDI